MLALIARGVSLGFAAGALPGPFQSYLVGTTLLRGWRYSLPVIVSPLVVDGLIILVVVFLLGQLSPDVIRVIQAAGGVFLLYIAWGTGRALRASADASPGAAGGGADSARGVFARGLMMNALSPGPYLFWGTVTGPLLVSALEQSALHALAFLGAFYGTFLTVLALIVLVFDRLRRLDDRVTRALLWLTLVVLVVFGVTLILGIDL
jgi:threonine/homoserine/homoserine lactone efflux protein